MIVKGVADRVGAVQKPFHGESDLLDLLQIALHAPPGYGDLEAPPTLNPHARPAQYPDGLVADVEVVEGTGVLALLAVVLTVSVPCIPAAR